MKNSIIFIDTNIFLDFYRFQGDSRLPLLDQISQNSNRIITSEQVQMEFKKNRQKVILELLKQMESPNWKVLMAPSFLADTKLAKAILKHKDRINALHSKLKNNLASIMKEPRKYDRVFSALEKLFANNGPYNLTRKKPILQNIYELAQKRFLLGYPPRKNDDTSCGDAINWEWIILCAQESNKHIIIVSRDKDYGDKYVNDWLLKEFRERVSHRRKIILMDNLSDAFKAIDIPVKKEEEREEKRLIDAYELNKSVLLQTMLAAETAADLYRERNK
jgi:hypothetical protein